MAIAKKGFWCDFVIMCCSVAVVAGNTLHIGDDSLIRNKRLSTGCLLKQITCDEKPLEYCYPGVCLSVEEELVDYPPFLVCVPKCGPLATTTNSLDNETGTTTSTGAGLNGTVSSTPMDGMNRTLYVNQTQTTQTSSPTGSTTLHWKDDPTYCQANFHCKNGGICDPEFKNLLGSNIPGKCICLDDYQGLLCEIGCSLNCHTNSTCSIHENGTQFCTCPSGSDIPGCENFPLQYSQPEPQPKPVWFFPVIAVTTLVLLIVLLYFILLKLRWRSLLVTKMFHFLQPYEDDDDKLFDAFISFRSSNKDYSQSEDEKFVHKVLQPVLEKESSYKLCIHQRDFTPGETIANNIIWAVENSRRTILVLSPLYVDSGWTRMEYQKALEEMSKLRHKIIPIIFEDVSNIPIEDPTLKQILSSVTYINYPKASNVKDTKRFWSMLHLALPKIRTTTTAASPETVSGERVTGPSLESQESWQSTRADVTDVPMVTHSNGTKTSKDTIIDINKIDKIKVIGDMKLNKKQETMNNNAEKYVAVLEQGCYY